MRDSMLLLYAKFMTLASNINPKFTLHLSFIKITKPSLQLSAEDFFK